ncbi:MAG: DNA internalization-related competence protein ComEC/Rec2, partial [Armatimonadetes bacterium]|nr:DNA internalization-related competence protein ComEC/Rec2 [Armatimonadota bacterium]
LLLAYNWRENIIKNSLKLLPDLQSSELLSSIILGEKSNLPRNLEKSFIVTGTLHLLAASGLNVAVLILFCMTMGKLFNLSAKISSFIAIPIIIFYTLAAGADPSIVRAAIMGILALMALILNREKEIVHFIFLSALLILFFKPFWLFEVSFQLSYLAVLGIIYLAPLIEEKISFLPKVIKTSLAISLGAQIFVSPLLAYYFNQLSLISLLANLILVPIAEILLPLGILMGNLGIIYLPLAYPLAFLNFLLIKILIKLLYILSSIPLAFIWIKTPSILFLIFYFISLILIIYFKAEKRIIFLTILIFIIYGILNFIFTPKNLKVAFLDVSEGDSIFISFPYSKNLLIDTGNSALTKKVVIPYLHHLGISKLNYVLITHSHSDHAGGLKDISDNFSIEKVYSPLDEKIIQILRAAKINWQKAKAGSEIHLNSKIAIKILHPPLMPLFKTKNDLNNNSAVSQLNFQKINFLFAADIEKEGEDFLARKISVLGSAVLKVPHQGSSTSCTLNFLKKIHPQYAVISVSKDNPYHHPSLEVLKRLNKQKVITYQTAKSGTITFSTSGEDIKIETMY